MIDNVELRDSFYTRILKTKHCCNRGTFVDLSANFCKFSTILLVTIDNQNSNYVRAQGSASSRTKNHSNTL